MKNYEKLNYYCFNVKASDWYNENKVSFRRYIRFDNKLKLEDIQKKICSESKKMVLSQKDYPWFRIECNNDFKFVIENYCLDDFIRNNCINPRCINVLVDFPDGLGAGGCLGESITMEIRARENEHKQRPHVHVYKRRRFGVSIALWNFDVLCGEENWKKEFSSKERREILKTIQSYQKEFSSSYNDLQNGLVPENVFYTYQEEECCLKFKS